MRKSAKLITALSVAGLAVAAGSAFTAGNTFATDATAPLTGYGTTTVSGATVNSLEYNLDGPGANVVTATLALAGDTTLSTVKMNFNNGTAFACTIPVAWEIGDPSTIYTCTPLAPLSASTLTSTGVVVN
jgi:hypothetical protein